VKISPPNAEGRRPTKNDRLDGDNKVSYLKGEKKRKNNNSATAGKLDLTGRRLRKKGFPEAKKR